MEVLYQDQIVCHALNELLREIRKNYILTEHRLSFYENVNAAADQPSMKFRSYTFPGRRPIPQQDLSMELSSNKTEKEEEEEEESSGGENGAHIIDKLNEIIEGLEASFLSLTRSRDSMVSYDLSHEGYATLPNHTNGGIQDERYILDNYSRYMSKKVLHTVNSPRKRRCSDSNVSNRNESDVDSSMIHTISQHSTLCRRLKTLEASYGVTFKKQLQFFIKKKMKDMNISGCVYCMYAFYEKQKREAEERAKQIRKTLEEQEHLQQRLVEQKAQSDADSQWLESTKNDEADGGQGSDSKSDSEQLGYDLYKEDFARDILEQKINKARNSPFRRSIPLWPFEKNGENKTAKISPLALETQLADGPPDNSSAAISEESHVATSTVADRDVTPPPPSSEQTEKLRSNSESVIADYAKVNKRQDSALDGSIVRCNTTGHIERNHTKPSITKTKSDQGLTIKEDEETDGSVDTVYQHTTSVVKSVIELNTGVQHAQPEEFVDLVKVVGLNLRDLLAEVDKEIQKVPSVSHKEIEMAHKVLSSDMAELVGKMKLAQKYADTTLDQQNRRNMLAAAHALAIDAKNLYDTFSKLKKSGSESDS